MKTIVVVIGSLQCGGAERQLADMANYWARAGADVTVATWSGPDVADFYKIEPNVTRRWLAAPVSRWMPKLLLSMRGIAKLRRLLRLSRPDAVLSFINVSNVFTVLASFGLGLRVVVAERTQPAVNYSVKRIWRLLRWMLYARAAVVAAQTRDAARWIEATCRVPTVVIPNFLRRLPEIVCAREPLILAVGRLSREKGFDLLLNAFAQIAAQFPAWRVAIVGEGPELAALVKVRDRHSLRERVDFVGEVENVEIWMARAGLLVHPSRREGFPNVVLEAMGMGACVICTDCRSGPAELIADKINGRLIAVDDEDALARVMSELMVDAKAREQLGRAARAVRQKYEQSMIMRKWEGCLLPECKP